jgi:hypothetical protein
MTTETSLIASVRNRLNISDADHRATDANIREFLNFAIEFLSVQQDWPWHRVEQSLALVGGTKGYTLGTAARVVRHIVIESEDLVLKQVTHRRAADAFSWEEGIPKWWTFDNGTIEVFPTPDQAYTCTVRYLKYADRLTTGSDQVDSPDVFDQLIVTKAAAYVAEKLRDSEMAQLLNTSFTRELQEFKAMAADTRSPIGVDIRDDWLI